MTNHMNNRIEKIKAEHIELLNMAKENILNNKDNFASIAEETQKVLKTDEVNVKKYEAIVKAQELIVSLTEEIMDAKSADEVIAIRKKINYYINKIKNELKSRGVNEELMTKYQDKTSSLRSSIATFLRYSKRENNLSEIDKLASNYDNLSKEELEKLRSMLCKENTYNRRNLNPTPKKATKSVAIDSKELNKEIEFDFPIESKEKITSNEDFIFPKANREENKTSKFISTDSSYEKIHCYFKNKVDNYDRYYGIQKTYDYEKNKFGRNVVNFFRNVPRYVHNKKAIERMEKDSYIYYGGSDFTSFIEYMKRRNSIRQSIKCLFCRSRLFTSDMDCLFEHENCTKWMYEYCQEKVLVPVLKNVA